MKVAFLIVFMGLSIAAYAEGPTPPEAGSINANAPTLTGLTTALLNCRAQFSNPKCDMKAAHCTYTLSDCGTIEQKWSAAGGHPTVDSALPDPQDIIRRHAQ